MHNLYIFKFFWLSEGIVPWLRLSEGIVPWLRAGISSSSARQHWGLLSLTPKGQGVLVLAVKGSERGGDNTYALVRLRHDSVCLEILNRCLDKTTRSLNVNVCDTPNPTVVTYQPANGEGSKATSPHFRQITLYRYIFRRKHYHITCF